MSSAFSDRFSRFDSSWRVEGLLGLDLGFLGGMSFLLRKSITSSRPSSCYMISSYNEFKFYNFSHYHFHDLKL